MFALEFEDTCRILCVRFSGILVSEDISEIDRVLTEVIAWGGPLHGLLFDFSSVRAVGVPHTFVALRASLPLISPDCERAFVVPSGELRELVQAYAAQQQAYGTKAPHAVHSTSDAYEVLLLERPNFRPLGA